MAQKEKPAKLEEEDAEKLCSIVELDTQQSCLVLHDVYEKYKTLGYYPKELLQAVYFVIYRDCRKLYVKEKEAYKTAPDDMFSLKMRGDLFRRIIVKL